MNCSTGEITDQEEAKTKKTNFFGSSGSLLHTDKACLNDRALSLLDQDVT